MLSALFRRPAPVVPDWDRLRLVSSRSTRLRALHLCLLVDERPTGWSSVRCRDDGTLHWLDRPAGPDWALRLMDEAIEEWRRELDAAAPERRRATAA